MVIHRAERCFDKDQSGVEQIVGGRAKFAERSPNVRPVSP